MTSNLAGLATRLAYGRILTPSELRSVAEGLKQRPDLNGYALTGWVTEAEAKILEDTTLKRAVRFSLYPLPSGARVVISTIQAGALQVRWYVPLVDDGPRAWLRWVIENGTLASLLEVGEGRQVSWSQLPLPLERCDVLNALLASPVQVDHATALAEAARANVWFAHDEAVPSCLPDTKVTHVRVVTVVDGLCEAVDNASAPALVH